jgi:capsular exopolysaccharide synthesis family protein
MLNDQYSDSPTGGSPDDVRMTPARAGGRTYNDDGRMSSWAYSENSAVLPRKSAVDEADNSLRQLFSMLMRRKAILLATILLVLGVTMVYLMLTPQVYNAQAVLQIHAAGGSGKDDGDSGHNSLVMYQGNGEGGDHSFGTQLTILQSRQMRRGALSRLPQEMRDKLESFLNVSIEEVPDTTLVEIKVSSHDAEASAALANAYCEEYIQLSRADNRSQLQTALDYVNEQKGKVGQKLEAARAAVQRFKEQNNLVNVDSQATAIAGALSNLQAERQNVAVEQAEARAGIERSIKLIPTMKEYKIVPGQRQIRPEVTAIKSKITALNLERLELLQKYRPDRPEIQVIDDQLKALREQLSQEAQTEYSVWTNTLNDKRDSMEKNLIELQAKDWGLQAREAALAQATNQARAKLNQMPALERQMSDMALNLEGLEKSYTLLAEKQEALRMSQEAKVANGSRLFPAEVPDSPTSRFGKMMGSALLIGLLLALALTALVDWLDDGVYGEAEAKMVSKLPILAQIPQVGKAAQKKLTTGADVAGNDKQIGHMRESFRMLRTMIALSAANPNGYVNGSNGNGNGHAALGGGSTLATLETPLGTSPIRSVVITSSLPNEGKSVSSANLAITTALSGENVILVDCDLRHPSLHRFFELSNDIGLTSVVGGACSLEEALQDTRIPGLRVLTSGPVTLDPMQIINSAGARRCFEQLTEVADFVVVDTPPALVYAEAQVVAAMTDAMLLVISSQDAKKREVTRTRDLLEQTGMIPIGAILNKAPAGSDSTERYYAHYNA